MICPKLLIPHSGILQRWHLIIIGLILGFKFTILPDHHNSLVWTLASYVSPSQTFKASNLTRMSRGRDGFTLRGRVSSGMFGLEFGLGSGRAFFILWVTRPPRCCTRSLWSLSWPCTTPLELSLHLDRHMHQIFQFHIMVYLDHVSNLSI
ncbi:hypothetical protein U1Q18_052785 [Sarracenia purpurea var. burkii]